MNLKRVLVLLFLPVLTCLSFGTNAQTSQERYVRTAELEIAPEHMEEFKAAIREGIEAAIRLEPEVLALYAVYERDRPNYVRVFEIYVSEDSYRRHVRTAHFLKFRDVTDRMVVSRKLTDGVPIILGAK